MTGTPTYFFVNRYALFYHSYQIGTALTRNVLVGTLIRKCRVLKYISSSRSTAGVVAKKNVSEEE
jgi:hypothetical protein